MDALLDLLSALLGALLGIIYGLSFLAQGKKASSLVIACVLAFVRFALLTGLMYFLLLSSSIQLIFFLTAFIISLWAIILLKKA